MNIWVPAKPSSLVKSVVIKPHRNGFLCTLYLNLNGTFYQYRCVRTKTAMRLLDAESLGKYYNKYIKGKYKAIKLKSLDSVKRKKS